MRRTAIAAALLVAACSHSNAAPPAEPVPASAQAAIVAGSAVSGTYRLQPDIQSGNRPQPRARNAPQPSLVLASDSATVKSANATAPQRAATILLPGYSRPPRRGRAAGQAASWWPVGSDSVVVEFSQGPRSRIQLRGAAHSGSLRGDIWFISTEGSSFQLGTFTATKSR